jgi:hypothetical protein
MKTFFIWNQFEEGLEFGVVDYNAGHLNSKFINFADTSDSETDELNELHEKATWFDDLSDWMEAFREFSSDSSGYRVIECGFAA